MLRTIRTSITALVAMLLTCNAAFAYDFVCASHDYREQFCPADTRGGVQLINQFSSEGCFQGETWGYTPGGVWVSGGCRAEFVTGDYVYRDNNNGAAAAAIMMGLFGAAIAAGQDDHHHHYYYRDRWH
ncbi:MAG TPA: DUF3011 domain-containing protein [Rhizomicrobium sp.]|nr:DUF3011 domain-containing protein [Rhizomicrobium sp.]